MHLRRKSAPTRRISHSWLPQGCGFFILITSPTSNLSAISSFLSSNPVSCNPAPAILLLPFHPCCLISVCKCGSLRLNPPPSERPARGNAPSPPRWYRLKGSRSWTVHLPPPRYRTGRNSYTSADILQNPRPTHK